MTFVQRRIDLSFELGEGAFGNTGSNKLDVTRLRTSAKISKSGGMALSGLSLEVYGLDPSTMRQLSTLGLVWTATRHNIITVKAGDLGGAMSVVFTGTIKNAWADFNNMPNVPFRVEASAGLIEAVKPISPTSFKGTVSAANVLSGLATQANLAFENSGVDVQLTNPYYVGSARDQIVQCVNEVHCSHIIDNGRLAIWNAGQARGSEVPEVSAATGMIRVPTFTSNGIHVDTVYNPSISFGSKINVTTENEAAKPANGIWVVNQLNYDLEAMIPHGKWFSNFEALRVQNSAGITPP